MGYYWNIKGYSEHGPFIVAFPTKDDHFPWETGSVPIWVSLSFPPFLQPGLLPSWPFPARSRPLPQWLREAPRCSRAASSRA